MNVSTPHQALDQMIMQIVRDYGVRTRTYIRWADEPADGESMPDLSAAEDDVADRS